jgi:hypothetical protein
LLAVERGDHLDAAATQWATGGRELLVIKDFFAGLRQRVANCVALRASTLQALFQKLLPCGPHYGPPLVDDGFPDAPRRWEIDRLAVVFGALAGKLEVAESSELRIPVSRPRSSPRSSP